MLLDGAGGRRRGIANPGVAIGEGDPLGLDQQMQIGGGVVAERLQIVALENVEHLERHDALGVGRQLQDLVAAIRGRERLDPVGMIRSKIRGGDEAAALLKIVGDRLADRPTVERIASAARDLLQTTRRAPDS